VVEPSAMLMYRVAVVPVQRLMVESLAKQVDERSAKVDEPLAIMGVD
jgi:hypothetical protein